MQVVNRNPVFLFFTREKGARAPTPASNCLKSTFLPARHYFQLTPEARAPSTPPRLSRPPRSPEPRARGRHCAAWTLISVATGAASTPRLNPPQCIRPLRSRLAPPGARRVVGRGARLVGLSAPMIRQRRQSADDLRSGDGDDAPAVNPPATILAPAQSIFVDRTQPIAFHKNICHCSEAPFSGLVGGEALLYPQG